MTGIQLLFINTLNQIVGSQRQDDPILDIAEKLLLIGDLLPLDEIRTLIMNSIKVSEYTPRDEVLWQDAYQHFVSITNPI